MTFDTSVLRGLAGTALLFVGCGHSDTPCVSQERIESSFIRAFHTDDGSPIDDLAELGAWNTGFLVLERINGAETVVVVGDVAGEEQELTPQDAVGYTCPTDGSIILGRGQYFLPDPPEGIRSVVITTFDPMTTVHVASPDPESYFILLYQVEVGL